jgi:anti-sigma factor RsiW
MRSASNKERIMREQDLLHAYVDGQLDAPTRARVEASLASDEAARAAVAAWQGQNEQLRSLERATLDEPIPLALLAAAAGPRLSPRSRRQRQQHQLRALGRRIDRLLARLAHGFGRLIERLFGTPVEHSVLPQALAIALVLGLGVGTGWFSHRAWADRDTRGELARADRSDDPTGSAVGGAGSPTRAGHDAGNASSVARGLMRDAMVAHVVYTADTRRPVEVAASEQDQLLRWLSRRLGRPLQLPALTDQGWNLVGGRLLPGDTSGASATRAQFMYQDKAGQRLTLYLSVLDPSVIKRKAQGGSSAADTASGTLASGSNGAAAAASSATDTALAQMSESSTAFSYASRDKTNSFYWTEGSFGYALVGELPRAALERISVEVYMQTVGLDAQAGPSASSASR